MNVGLVLVLVMANLRQVRAVLPAILGVGLVLSLWIPIGVLRPPAPSGTTVGVKAPDLPEVAGALSAAGFRVEPIPDGRAVDPVPAGIDAVVDVSGPGSGLPRKARITFADATGNLVLDGRLRSAILSSSSDYARRLSREAGLPPEAETPIRIDRTSQGPLSKAAPAASTLFEAGRFAPPLMLAVCLSLALFGILPVQAEAFHFPRCSGRLEALFPIRVRPREIVASLVGTQAVVAGLYAAIVGSLVLGGGRWAGLVPLPGAAEAMAWAPVVAACVVPYVVAASTLFRTQSIAMAAAVCAGGIVGGAAYVPTLVEALLGSPGAMAAWPIHGLLAGSPASRAASLGLTLGVGAVGFTLACRRLDGRMLVRVDH